MHSENNSPQSAFCTDCTTKCENHVSCGYAIGLTSFILPHQLKGHKKKHTARLNEQDYRTLSCSSEHHKIGVGDEPVCRIFVRVSKLNARKHQSPAETFDSAVLRPPLIHSMTRNKIITAHHANNIRPCRLFRLPQTSSKQSNFRKRTQS